MLYFIDEEISTWKIYCVHDHIACRIETLVFSMPRFRFLTSVLSSLPKNVILPLQYHNFTECFTDAYTAYSLISGHLITTVLCGYFSVSFVFFCSLLGHGDLQQIGIKGKKGKLRKKGREGKKTICWWRNLRSGRYHIIDQKCINMSFVTQMLLSGDVSVCF